METIKKRLAAAPTDEGCGEKVPARGGVANLLTLVELFQGKARRTEYEKQYTSTGIRYSDLKKELAEAIYSELKPIQEKRAELEEDRDYVEKILKDGAKKARSIASRTLSEVRFAMGLS